MSFGAELKDFVSSFQAGYNLVKSKDEKEWEKEERRMKQELHKRTFDRDVIGDDQWGESNRYRWDRANRSDFDSDRSYDFNEKTRKDTLRERGAAHERWIKEHKRLLTKDEFEQSGGAGFSDDFETYEDYERHFREESGGAIPDGSDEGARAEPVAFRQRQAFGDDTTAARHPTLINDESGGRWNARNNAVGSGGKRGHFGRIQFGVARLNDAKRAGVIPRNMTPQQFMASPRAQLAAEKWHFSDIDREARRRGLSQFLGQTVAGVRVTPDAIRAMAHLGGIKGAERFLKSGGRYNPKDVNGTSLRDYGIRHGGTRRRTVNAALGGMIEEPEEETFSVFDMPANSLVDPEDDMQEDTQVAQASGAIPLPDEGPIPPPKYEGVMEGDDEAPTDDPWEQGRRAVRDGLKRALEESGAGANAPIDDPDLERRRQAYIRGYGAAHPKIMKQAMDLIDPDRKMPPSERSIKAIGSVYNYYVKKNDYEKATATAAEMIQAMRVMSQQQWALAQAAAAKGDIDNAARAAVAAYANIPNGRDLKVTKTESGQYEVSVTDERTGKTISKQIMSPKELGAAAMKFNPGTFDEEIYAAAGMPLDKMEGKKFADAETASENSQSAIDTLAPEGENPFIDNFRPVLSDLASGIAGERNNMPTSEAARIVLGFVNNITVKPGEDGKLSAELPFEYERKKNSDGIWTLTFNGGQTIEVSNNQFRTLMSVMEKRADELEAEAQRKMKDDASSEKVGENVGGFVQSGVDMFRRIGAAQRRAMQYEEEIEKKRQGPPIPEPTREQDPNEEEITRLLDQQQQLRYSGVTDPSDPRMREIDMKLRELGYQ
jgi:hypothetical protein